MKTICALAVVVVLFAWIGGVQTTNAQSDTTRPLLIYIGFSPALPPANSQSFRQALAYAIDRDAVAKAANSDLRAPRHYPATVIQSPELPGYNADAKGYGYDPARAKALYGQTVRTSPITIFIPPDPGRAAMLVYDAVRASIQQTLGTEVILQKGASFSALVKSARAGQVAAFMWGWGSSPHDFGYPSFALGLANDYELNWRDLELQDLVRKGDSKGVEQFLLDAALIIPVVRR